MSDAADIDVDISAIETIALEEALGASCTGTTTWSRDGILEHQVSTREDVQLCFRNEPSEERPRTGICLAGTDERLSVAAVVTIDRDPELDPETRSAVVEEFYRDILEPALEDLAAEAELTTRSKPSERGGSGPP